MSVAGIRVAVVASAAMAAMIGFCMGFAQYPNPGFGQRDGLVVGLGSAVAWAIASVCSAGPWSNWFNLFAAVFAALSLGYLTPGDALCRREQSSVSDKYVWQGQSPVLVLPCGWRAMDPLSPREVMDAALTRSIGDLENAQRSTDAAIIDIRARLKQVEEAAQAIHAPASPPASPAK